MTNQGLAAIAVAAILLVASPSFAQESGQSQAVVTVLPKHEGELPPSVIDQDLSVKLDGKFAKVATWAQYKDPNDGIEFVLLIDGGARNSLGREISDIDSFIKSLPPNIKAGIAYMENGRALFAGPLSADHAEVLKNLHLPGGFAGVDASPYFCLSDLARKWPSQDPAARREVLMVTDGVDTSQRAYDPDDPYVQAAITDAARAHLVVYSIYWKSQGRMDNTEAANDTGQNLLSQIAQATGGKSFWQGMGNPVSLAPYFDELSRRFRNQWELGLVVPLSGKPQVESLKMKLSAPGTEIDTPQQVYVYPAAATAK